jgi:hypothetical protein
VAAASEDRTGELLERHIVTELLMCRQGPGRRYRMLAGAEKARMPLDGPGPLIGHLTTASARGGIA